MIQVSGISFVTSFGQALMRVVSVDGEHAIDSRISLCKFSKYQNCVVSEWTWNGQKSFVHNSSNCFSFELQSAEFFVMRNQQMKRGFETIDNLNN